MDKLKVGTIYQRVDLESYIKNNCGMIIELECDPNFHSSVQCQKLEIVEILENANINNYIADDKAYSICFRHNIIVVKRV